MKEYERVRNLDFPDGEIDCILDTDAFNEVDDQFAVSFMVKSPRYRVKGICAAPFSSKDGPAEGMEQSYREILHLLDLLGRDDLKPFVFRGSGSFLTDEKTPVESDAATFICEEAMRHSMAHPLYVIGIGAGTNIASALLKQPVISDRIVVVWLGGNYVSFPNGCDEYNMIQDISAGRIIFGSGCPLVQVPCEGVASQFSVSGLEMEHWLKGKNPVCDYLCSHVQEVVDTYIKDGRPWTRILWDVVAVAWPMDNGRIFTSEYCYAPIPERDGYYGIGTARHLMRRITLLDRDKLFCLMVNVLTQ